MTALRRMAPYIKRYPWSASLGFLTVFLMVATELVVPRALQIVIDQGIRAGSMAAVWRGVLFMLGAAVGGALATLGQGVFRARLSQGIASICATASSTTFNRCLLASWTRCKPAG